MQQQKLDKWPWETPEPGIYFDMSFEEYLSIPCMQSSGIKELCLSDKPEDGAMDYWSRSFMNPLCDEIDSDSKAKIEGRAYHKRILEGKEAFYNEYAPAYEHDPSVTVLETNKAMISFLKENDVKGTSGKNADELAIMLQDVPDAPPSLHALKKFHEAKYAGLELLDAKTIREIELCTKMIECHTYLKKFFVGGYPEVTVIWDDPHTGIRYKVRFDYLKVGPACDLKTFANQMRKTLKKAILHQIAGYKYHIQGALYITGRDWASHHVRNGRVFGAEKVDREWLKRLSETKNDEFWWVFQQKGIAPVAKGFVFDRKERLFATGISEIQRAADIFIYNYNRYGEDCWIDNSAPERVSSDDMPAFAYD